jgi:urea transporter
MTRRAEHICWSAARYVSTALGGLVGIGMSKWKVVRIVLPFVISTSIVVTIFGTAVIADRSWVAPKP